MKHNYYECKCGKMGCQFCEGGLSACTVCGGFEGTLTIDCCGYDLDEHVLQAIYKGGLNFIGKSWLVASKNIVKDPVALINWEENQKKLLGE